MGFTTNQIIDALYIETKPKRNWRAFWKFLADISRGFWLIPALLIGVLCSFHLDQYRIVLGKQIYREVDKEEGNG